jgi:hypothetical protein
MNIDLETMKKDIEEISMNYDNGVGLSLYAQIAKDVIRSERSYFYGDRNSTRRSKDMRNIIEDGFKEFLKEESNAN